MHEVGWMRWSRVHVCSPWLFEESAGAALSSALLEWFVWWFGDGPGAGQMLVVMSAPVLVSVGSFPGASALEIFCTPGFVGFDGTPHELGQRFEQTIQLLFQVRGRAVVACRVR